MKQAGWNNPAPLKENVMTIKVRYGFLNSQWADEDGSAAVITIEKDRFETAIQEHRTEAERARGQDSLLPGTTVHVEEIENGVEITQIHSAISEREARRIEQEEEVYGVGRLFVYRHGEMQIPYLCYTIWYVIEEELP